VPADEQSEGKVIGSAQSNPFGQDGGEYEQSFLTAAMLGLSPPAHSAAETELVDMQTETPITEVEPLGALTFCFAQYLNLGLFPCKYTYTFQLVVLMTALSTSIRSPGPYGGRAFGSGGTLQSIAPCLYPNQK
jgi:hypothetical protein